MEGTEGAVTAPSDGADAALERLATSAHGWHRLQLAVLGFIGFCGVFWGGDGGGPAAVQWAALALVVGAFVLALVATFLVGRVAYPLHGTGTAEDPSELPPFARQTRRLRTGIALTYLAVVMLVTATLSAWWPGTAAADDGAVVVAAPTGQTWCGQLLEAPAGELQLATTDGPVTIPLDRVALLRPVRGC